MRMQQSQQGELTASQIERYTILRQGFDPKTFDPNEDLTARFNALAQKLSASGQPA